MLPVDARNEFISAIKIYVHDKGWGNWFPQLGEEDRIIAMFHKHITKTNCDANRRIEIAQMAQLLNLRFLPTEFVLSQLNAVIQNIAKMPSWNGSANTSKFQTQMQTAHANLSRTCNDTKYRDVTQQLIDQPPLKYIDSDDTIRLALSGYAAAFYDVEHARMCAIFPSARNSTPSTEEWRYTATYIQSILIQELVDCGQAVFLYQNTAHQEQRADLIENIKQLTGLLQQKARLINTQQPTSLIDARITIFKEEKLRQVILTDLQRQTDAQLAARDRQPTPPLHTPVALSPTTAALQETIARLQRQLDEATAASTAPAADTTQLAALTAERDAARTQAHQAQAQTEEIQATVERLQAQVAQLQRDAAAQQRQIEEQHDMLRDQRDADADSLNLSAYHVDGNTEYTPNVVEKLVTEHKALVAHAAQLEQQLAEAPAASDTNHHPNDVREIASLRQQVNAMRRRASEAEPLKQEKAQLTQQIQQLQATIADQERKINKLEKRLRELDQEKQRLDGLVKQRNDEKLADLAELGGKDDQVRDLEQACDKLRDECATQVRATQAMQVERDTARAECARLRAELQAQQQPPTATTQFTHSYSTGSRPHGDKAPRGRGNGWGRGRGRANANGSWRAGRGGANAGQAGNSARFPYAGQQQQHRVQQQAGRGDGIKAQV